MSRLRVCVAGAYSSDDTMTVFANVRRGMALLPEMPLESFSACERGKHFS